VAEVLFGQSYFLRFDPKLWQAMQPYPPLGTLYAASYIREQGYDVGLFDAMLSETEEDWDIALDSEKPEFAVIYEDNFNYLSKMCLLRMRDAAFSMIEMAKSRNCRTIVCGSDATDHAAHFLARGADFVLIGEGEITLGELLDALTGRSETPLSEIEGLAFKSTESGTTKNSSDSAQLIHSAKTAGHRKSRQSTLSGLGSGGCRKVQASLASATWILLHEYGDDARLSLSLQLVRKAYLGPAL
jgi:hypothetical protein